MSRSVRLFSLGTARTGTSFPLAQKLTLAAFATLANGAIYLLPNHYPLFAPRELPITDLDRVIPFFAPAIWIYLSDLALVLAAFLVQRRRETALAFIEAYFAISVFAAAVHWLWPTQFPRELFPIAAGDSSISAWALSLYRRMDSATSCMPSMHVAGSFLAAFTMRARSRSLFALSFAWACVIAVSTLATKQHYAVDLLGGLALALAAERAFVERFVPVQPSAFNIARVRRLWARDNR